MYGWLGCGQVVKCRPFLFADIQSPVSGWLGDVTGQSIKQALITWSKGGQKVRTHLPYEYTHSRHLPPAILAIHSERRYSDIFTILNIHPVKLHTHALTTYPSGHKTPAIPRRNYPSRGGNRRRPPRSNGTSRCRSSCSRTCRRRKPRCEARSSESPCSSRRPVPPTLALALLLARGPGLGARVPPRSPPRAPPCRAHGF